MNALLVVVALAAAKSPAQDALKPKDRPYDAVHYRIDFRLKDAGRFENTAHVTLEATRPTAEIALDAYRLAIAQVTLDGRKLAHKYEENASAKSGTLTVKLPSPLARGKRITLAIQYSGTANTTNEGFFVTAEADAVDALPAYFTHFEPTYARQFFPSNDQPFDKATTEVFVIVDRRYQVLSNGAKVLDETFSEGGENLRRVHWKQAQPHPSYAVALAIGEFESVEVGGKVPAQIHVSKGKADRTFIAREATLSALKTLPEFLGVPYPYAKYDQVAVPRFTWGGMENTSLVMMRENGLVLEDKNHFFGRSRQVSLVAHELAHQWFGDLVTCRWWDDLWLNEGFASYLGEIAEDAYYDNDFIEVDRARDTFVSYFRMEDGPRARPLVGESATPQSYFDRVAYTKGAHVLRMLEAWVGTDAFRKALRAYLEKHAHKAATSDDLFATVSSVTGKPREISAFAAAWLRKKGYPVLTVKRDYAKGKVTVTVRQKPNHASENGHFVFKLPIVFHRQSEPRYTQREVLVMDKPEVKATFALPARPEWVNWNEGGNALARIHPPAIGEEEWIDGARKDPDPIWRLLAQYVLLGEMVNPEAQTLSEPSPAATSAVIEALKTDASPYVREATLQRMGMARWPRLPDAFTDVVLALAQAPEGLPEDAMGVIRVRRAAMELLGKFEDERGRKYLLEELARKDVDLNFLPALAVGVARLGDNAAIASLRAAVEAQRERGYPYFKAAAEALGAVQNPEVVPALRDLVQTAHGNSELLGHVVHQLWNNAVVKHSPEGVAFVRDFVVQNREYNDEAKSRVLALLDEVKTKQAQEVLVEIASKVESDVLRASAKEVLQRNFAQAPKPAKKKR